MLTITDIRNKVNAFPEEGPVEDLLDELVVLYKIEKGLKETDGGKGLSLSNFDKKMEAGWKSK